MTLMCPFEFPISGADPDERKGVAKLKTCSHNGHFFPPEMV